MFSRNARNRLTAPATGPTGHVDRNWDREGPVRCTVLKSGNDMQALDRTDGLSATLNLSIALRHQRPPESACIVRMFLPLEHLAFDMSS